MTVAGVRTGNKASWVLPDGRAISLVSSRSMASTPWDCILRVAPERLDGTIPDAVQSRDIFIAPRGNSEGIMREALDASVEQTLPSEGGHFVVARSSRRDLQGLALWRGETHEAMVWLLPKLENDFSDPLKGFSGLQFKDSTNQLQVVPRVGSNLRVSVSEVGIAVDGVGDLHIVPAEMSLAQVPAWRGAAVPAGEVWLMDDVEGSKQPSSILLVSDSVVVTISPQETSNKGMQAALDFAENLQSVNLAK